MKSIPVLAQAAEIVFGRNDLTPAHQALFLYLAKCCKGHGDEPNCHPALATLATALNTFERRVRRLLRDLERCGLVEPEFKNGRATRYRLHCDDPGQKVRGYPGQKVRGYPGQKVRGSQAGIGDPGQKVRGLSAKSGENQPVLQNHELLDPGQKVQGSVLGPRSKSAGVPRSLTVENLTLKTLEESKNPPKEKEKKETPPKNPPTSPKQANLSLIPTWLPAQPWADFVASRKAMRHPLTEGAVRLSIAKLDGFRRQGIDVASVLNLSVERGWRGLFDPREGTGQMGHGGRQAVSGYEERRAALGGLTFLHPDGLRENPAPYGEDADEDEFTIEHTGA